MTKQVFKRPNRTSTNKKYNQIKNWLEKEIINQKEFIRELVIWKTGHMIFNIQLEKQEMKNMEKSLGTWKIE